MMHKLPIPALLTIACTVFLSASCSEKKAVLQEFRIHDIPVQAQVAPENAEELSTIAATTSNVMHDILATLDREIPRLNQMAATARIPLNTATFRILDMGRYYSAITSNAYDYTLGPVQALWDSGEPDPGELIRAIGRSGIQFVDAQESGNITFSRSDITIKLGRMAEAYAIDTAAASLRSRTSGPYLISTDIMSRRARDFSDPPSIPMPARPGFTIGKFKLVRHGAVVVRSTGQKPVIVDPRDGRPARGGVMAVVAGALASKANALAEALIVLGPDEVSAILPAFPDYDVLLVTSLSPFHGIATEQFLAHAQIAPQLKSSIELWTR